MGGKSYIRLTAVIIMCFFILFNLSGCGKNSTITTETDLQEVPVEIVKAARGTIYDTVKTSGRITPHVEINVVPKIGGKVEKVNFDIGDIVKEGDVLLTLESRDIASSVKQAEAAVTMAEANYRSLSEGTLDKQLEQAEANFLNAKENYERMQVLYDEGAVSKQQFDAAKLQYTVAKTQYESAKIAAPGNLEAAGAQLKQAQAGLELARSQLENTVIKSPVSGMVASKSVNVGEMAAPGYPVFTIVNIDKVYVDLDISEVNIGSVEKGQKVSVTVSAADKTEFSGIITNVSPSADPRSRTFPVRVEIDNAEHILKGGMFAQVLIQTEKKEDAVLVPEESVVDMGTEKVVFVVNDDTAYKKSVVVGINDGINVEIIKGIKEGEQVVKAGQHLLRDKTKVSVVNRGDKE